MSTTATPPTHWSPTENILWKAPIDGAGSGSPIVWEQQVFVVTAVPVGDGALDFRVLCFDRRTGKPQWQQTATRATPHQGIHETNTHASASPCTDGQYVYAHFGSRGLYAYTMDGQLAWKRDDFPPMDTRLAFGEGSSPTIAGDRLLVPYDHEGQSWLAALDRHTGKTLWQIERDEPTNWATPLIVSHEGRQQVIMNGENYVRSYDLATGEELWRCGGQTQRPVASPVANDEMVFVGSGFRGSFLAAFRLGGEGDIRGSDQVVWTIQRDTPDIASLLLSENRLYFHKQKSGILTCVDASTGQKHFGPQRIPELRTIYASPIAAGGHVYVTGRDGTTVVIKDQPRFEIVATNSVGEGVDATPAPVDNQLFIRGNQHLFCIQAAD
ncbi:outer membrane protein assembly factor BamB family protein [Roseimaritima sediminicola]|uniref:outer membrane protein assembly factor BamB family protein n=1 Tax=Roseimaritima sediminicola TaxID=2662066 RepID=UPI001F377515|nr:PQQ-binding-like beta-propeller repeat protein [Roseimaritima sediminicola]